MLQCFGMSINDYSTLPIAIINPFVRAHEKYTNTYINKYKYMYFYKVSIGKKSNMYRREHLNQHATQIQTEA